MLRQRHLVRLGRGRAVAVLANLRLHRADPGRGQIGRGEHADHSRRRRDPAQFQRNDGGVRMRAETEIDMDKARRLGDIVDEQSFAGDMLVGAVMGQRLVDAALNARGPVWSEPLRH